MNILKIAAICIHWIALHGAEAFLSSVQACSNIFSTAEKILNTQDRHTVFSA